MAEKMTLKDIQAETQLEEGKLKLASAILERKKVEMKSALPDFGDVEIQQAQVVEKLKKLESQVGGTTTFVTEVVEPKPKTNYMPYVIAGIAAFLLLKGVKL